MVGGIEGCAVGRGAVLGAVVGRGVGSAVGGTEGCGVGFAVPETWTERHTWPGTPAYDHCWTRAPGLMAEFSTSRTLALFLLKISPLSLANSKAQVWVSSLSTQVHCWAGAPSSLRESAISRHLPVTTLTILKSRVVPIRSARHCDFCPFSQKP
nr:MULTISPECIES: hypothetical protein [Streptomyces]